MCAEAKPPRKPTVCINTPLEDAYMRCILKPLSVFIWVKCAHRLKSTERNKGVESV